MHPEAWWIWCSLSLPASLFLIYHAQQPSAHKVNFCMWWSTVTGSASYSGGEVNEVNCLQTGAPSVLVYSNYPLCLLPINTLDQSSHRWESWKGEKSKEMKWGVCRKWQSKLGKSMWEGRDKWRCEIWRKTWQGEEKGWKRREGMTKTPNTFENQISPKLHRICGKK